MERGSPGPVIDRSVRAPVNPPENQQSPALLWMRLQTVLVTLVGAPRIAALSFAVVTGAVLIAYRLPVAPMPILAGVAIVLAVVVAELRPVRVGRESQHQNFTLIEGPVVLVLALFPGAYGVIAVAIGIAIAQLRRRIVPFKLVFNVALFAFATAVGAWCAGQVVGVAGVVTGIAAFTLVNELLMRVVLWVATGRRFGYAYQEGDVVRLLHVAATTCVALIAVNTWQNAPELLPAFLGPVVLLQWSQEQSNRRREQSAIAQSLAQQATSLYGRSSQESAVLILRSARELLTCAEAEIVLLGVDGAMSLRDGGSTGKSPTSRLTPDELLEGWKGIVFESVQATSGDRWAGVVIGGATPVALLGVWRSGDQDVFRDIDRALLQQLADDVQTWLVPDAGMSDAVGTARIRAAELGGSYDKVADALGNIVQVRSALLADAALAEIAQPMAEELRLAADGIAEFLSELIAIPEQGADEDVVHTGRWIANSA